MSGPFTPKAHCSPNALRRFRFPQEYPCYVDGAYDYRPASGCRAKCCVMVGTPESDDTPKWKATLAAQPLAARQPSPMAQPKFDDEEPQVATPFKDHVAPSSGSTPLGASSFNHRIHLCMMGGPDFNTQPGVGWREESPVKLYPPTAHSRAPVCSERARPRGVCGGAVHGRWAERSVGEGKIVKVTFRNRSKTVKVALRTDPSKTVKAPGPPETLPSPYVGAHTDPGWVRGTITIQTVLSRDTPRATDDSVRSARSKPIVSVQRATSYSRLLPPSSF